MGINYENLISQIQRNLPTLPTVLNELSNIMKDPNCSSIAVEEVMASDQSMTMKILRVANTSFYRGSRARVTSTSEAIGSLGFEKIKNIALTTSVFEFFSNEKEKDKLLLEDLWKHSLGVGWASRNIARILNKSWDESAYSCGLLHDIGKIAKYKLNEVENESSLLNDVKIGLDQKIDFFKAEILNHSPRHDYLGYLICWNWGLSKSLEMVVRWHHEPNPKNRKNIESVDVHELIDIVILANWIVIKLGFGFSGDKYPTKPPDALFRRLNLNSDLMHQVIERTYSELECATETMSSMEFNSSHWEQKDSKLQNLHDEFGKNTQDHVNESIVENDYTELPSNCDSELRNDFLGILSSLADLNDTQIEPIEISTEREKLIFDWFELQKKTDNSSENIELK
jgi:HD-like signal output (HDOD) protein